MRTQNLFFLIFLIVSCKTETRIDNKEQKEKWIMEIRQAEKDFNDMAAEKGVHDAFVQFADPDAAIMRGNKIIKGIDSIDQYLQTSSYQNVSLTWAPDFVDVSSSGDLGYTYGKYSFSATDSTGKEIKSEGIFHTVWKRQEDGSWKYVYD